MKHLIKAVKERYIQWYICLGEDPALRETKIKFFEKCGPYHLEVKGVLWQLAKAIYPSSLAIEKIDVVIERVRYVAEEIFPYLHRPRPKQPSFE